MTREELLELFKFELGFLEQGGYGRSVRMPQKPSSMFQDSPTCLNFDDPSRPHACSECALLEFVPPEHRSDRVPCHHIPLNSRGETIEKLSGDQLRLEEALGEWLKREITSLKSAVDR